MQIAKEVIMGTLHNKNNTKVHKNITKSQYLSTLSKLACSKLSEALKKAKERVNE